MQRFDNVTNSQTSLIIGFHPPEHIRMPFSSQFPVSLGNVPLWTLPVHSKHLKWFIEVKHNTGEKLSWWSQAAPHSSSCPHSRCLVAFGLPVPPWRQPQGPQWQGAPPTPPSLSFPLRLQGHLQVSPHCGCEEIFITIMIIWRNEKVILQKLVGRLASSLQREVWAVTWAKCRVHHQSWVPSSTHGHCPYRVVFFQRAG